MCPPSGRDGGLSCAGGLHGGVVLRADDTQGGLSAGLLGACWPGLGGFPHTESALCVGLGAQFRAGDPETGPVRPVQGFSPHCPTFESPKELPTGSEKLLRNCLFSNILTASADVTPHHSQPLSMSCVCRATPTQSGVSVSALMGCRQPLLDGTDWSGCGRCPAGAAAPH